MSLSNTAYFTADVPISDELRELALETAQSARDRGDNFRDGLNRQLGQYHLRGIRRKVEDYIWRREHGLLTDDEDPELVAKVAELDATGKVFHKPEPAVVQMHVGGSLATVKRERRAAVLVGGGVRGVVKEFSRDSARRLKQTVAKIRNDKLPYFVTLTYADTYDKFSDPTAWKNDLKRFAQRFGRKWAAEERTSKGSFVWRLEMAVRKSGVHVGCPRPHFHLLVYGLHYNEYMQFREWVHKSWYDITNTGSEPHIRTKVERIRSKYGVSKYVSKTMSKVLAGEVGKMSQAVGQHIGRWWGVYFRGSVPWGVEDDTVLTDQQAKELLRLFRKHAGLSGKDFRSLTVFLDTNYWSKCLPWLLYPDAYKHVPGQLRSEIFSR